MKAKNKQGVYSSLGGKRQISGPITREVSAVTLTGIIRLAFLDYARKHGCKPQLEEVEWTRFRKILQKYI